MKRKGFTLVELLAVIAILAILVIIALPNVLKMFNDSKKNAFIVQARKTASVAQQKLITGTEKTFDCNELLTGQKFKDCTATTSNNKVTVDVLGSGTYENFLMIDVTSDGNSGTFVDLSKLKVMDIEKPLKEDLIKNGKINEPTFKLMSGEEYLNYASNFTVSSLSPEEQEKEIKAYNDYIKSLTIQENKITGSNDEEKVIIIKANIKNNGKYSFIFGNNFLGEAFMTKTILEAWKADRDSYEDNFEKYINVAEKDKIIATVNDNDIIYFPYMISKDNPIENFTLEQISSENGITLNGDVTVYLTSSDVLSYKDSGISYKGKILSSADNEVFEYGKIDSKEGTYKYNYIVRTKDGYEKFTREIIVANYNSEKCFKFNTETQEIEQYYYFEDNKSGGKSCPMNVVIPDKINNVQVKSIGYGAFMYGCDNNFVVPTSLTNKYEIKRLSSCLSFSIGITSVKLPEGLETIGRDAFAENKLKIVTIPASVTTIGNGAFYNNELQSVVFEGDKNNINVGCGTFNGDKHSTEVNSLSKNTCE